MWNRLQHYRFDWKLTLLVLIFLPLMLRLGFWQLSREQEKLALLADYEARQAGQPVALDSLDTESDLQFVPVTFRGTADNAHLFYLDNRVYQGKPGYELIQAVSLDSGLRVFLNRGWVAQGVYRSELPEVEPLPEVATYRGVVHMPVGDPVVLGDDLMTADWPRVVQVEDVTLMAKGMNGAAPVFPYTVRIDEGVPGALTRFWPVVNLRPEMHKGYAVQWFAMSLTLVLIYLYYSTRTYAAENSREKQDS